MDGCEADIRSLATPCCVTWMLQTAMHSSNRVEVALQYNGCCVRIKPRKS